MGRQRKKKRGEGGREEKKDHSLAMNGWLTWGTKWIRVYGRSTTPRGQG